MSENEDLEKKDKATHKILRQRRGGLPKEILDRNRENTRIRRSVTNALSDGSKTVPEIARATGIPAHEVLWHLMSMRKYGKVVEGEASGDYIQYALKQEEDGEK